MTLEEGYGSADDLLRLYSSSRLVIELRFLEKDLLFLRLVLVNVVLVRVPVLVAEEVLLEVGMVDKSLRGRKLSKTKGSFVRCSMDTLLGAFVGDLLKLLRMHSLEGMLVTSWTPCSLPK